MKISFENIREQLIKSKNFSGCMSEFDLSNQGIHVELWVQLIYRSMNCTNYTHFIKFPICTIKLAVTWTNLIPLTVYVIRI